MCKESVWTSGEDKGGITRIKTNYTNWENADAILFCDWYLFIIFINIQSFPNECAANIDSSKSV